MTFRPGPPLKYDYIVVGRKTKLNSSARTVYVIISKQRTHYNIKYIIIIIIIMRATRFSPESPAYNILYYYYYYCANIYIITV